MGPEAMIRKEEPICVRGQFWCQIDLFRRKGAWDRQKMNKTRYVHLQQLTDRVEWILLPLQFCCYNAKQQACREWQCEVLSCDQPIVVWSQPSQQGVFVVPRPQRLDVAVLSQQFETRLRAYPSGEFSSRNDCMDWLESAVPGHPLLTAPLFLLPGTVLKCRTDSQLVLDGELLSAVPRSLHGINPDHRPRRTAFGFETSLVTMAVLHVSVSLAQDAEMMLPPWRQAASLWLAAHVPRVVANLCLSFLDHSL